MFNPSLDFPMNSAGISWDFRFQFSLQTRYRTTINYIDSHIINIHPPFPHHFPIISPGNASPCGPCVSAAPLPSSYVWHSTRRKEPGAAAVPRPLPWPWRWGAAEDPSSMHEVPRISVQNAAVMGNTLR